MWYIASHAKKEKNEHSSNYYNFLALSFPNDVPLINEKQIDLDINRTATPYKDKLKRILLAYSKRNSSIGYIQGFNFIVDKILRFVDDEEKAFWIFVVMLEDILPINYYSEMAGVMSDVDLVLCIVDKFYFGNMSDVVNDSGYMYFKNVVFQWFLTLFTVNFNEEVTSVVWDVMFIEKTEAMFKAAVTMIRMIREDIAVSGTNDIMTVKNVIGKYTSMKDINFVNEMKISILLKKYNFDQKLIELNRNEIGKMIVVKINKTNENKKEKLKEKNKLKTEPCEVDWPFCLYDDDTYTVMNCLVLQTSKGRNIIEDYFDKQIEPSTISLSDIEYDDILIERKRHKCKLHSTCSSLRQSGVGIKKTDSLTHKISGFRREEIHDEKKLRYKSRRIKGRFVSSEEDCVVSDTAKVIEKKKVRNFEAFCSRANFKYNLVSTARNYNIITGEEDKEDNMYMSLNNIGSNFII